MSTAAASMSAPVSIASQIKRAVAGVDLSSAEMREAMNEIMDGDVSPAQVAALLVALAIKGETADEVAGAASAMREHAIAVSPRAGAIDVCGTGGDGSGTFNISTAVAFVVAGAGVPVAKHGNRAMSSRCGSADVLEALGVRIGTAPDRTAQILLEQSIAFLFAQAHHPAMRHVAPVRREIGVRTLFNILGPLTNPAGVRRQVVGVAQQSTRRLVAEALGRLGSERAAAVHGCDGLDEVTLSGPTSVAEWTGDAVIEYEIAPEEADLQRRDADLRGGDATENAIAIRSVLDGHAGDQRDVVLLNAALALRVAGAATDLRAGRAQAERSIDSGAARGRLEALVKASNA
jgi:anthranilate phosphoribosyltransferase